MSIKDKLHNDLEVSQRNLAEAEALCKQLRWQIQYIETLLKAEVREPKADKPARTLYMGEANLNPSAIYAGLTMPEVMRAILETAGTPLKMREIAEKAIAGGFGGGKWDLNKLALNFSSVAVKDKKRRRGGERFVRVGPALYDLAERHRDAPKLSR